MRLRNSNGSFKRGCATGTVASDGPAGDGVVPRGRRKAGVWAGPGRVAGGCRGLLRDAKASMRWPVRESARAGQVTLTGRNRRAGTYPLSF
jgi:hypothetical protein